MECYQAVPAHFVDESTATLQGCLSGTFSSTVHFTLAALITYEFSVCKCLQFVLPNDKSLYFSL